MHTLHAWLAAWAIEHGAAPDRADAFATLALVFAVIAVVMLVTRRFGSGGAEAIEQTRVNGRAYIHHPTLGFFAATHSKTTGEIEGWEACGEPQDLEAPPTLVMPSGARKTLSR